MKLRFAASILTLTIGLSGCGLVRNLAATSPIAPSIAFRTVSPPKDRPGDLRGPAQTLVVKSQAELDAFLKTLPVTAYDDHGPIPPSLPALDFQKEQGVIVLFGPQPNGSYGGEIGAIEELTDRFVVRPIRWQPNPVFPGGTLAIVYPHHYVAMPRSEKPVEFAATVDRPRPGPWWWLFF